MKNNKKTINRKRIIARIVALCATLGVIIALALPCFAVDFEVPEPPIAEAPVTPPDITDNIALSEKQNMFISSLAPGFSDNDCAYFLSDYYWIESATYGGIGLFDYDFFISGKMVNLGNYSFNFNRSHLYELTSLGRNYSFEEQFYLDSFCVEVEDMRDDTAYTVTGSRQLNAFNEVVLPWVGFTFTYNYSSDTVTVRIRFHDSASGHDFSIWYTGYFDREYGAINNLNLEFDFVEYNSGVNTGAVFGDDASYVSYAFVPRFLNYPTLYFNAVTTLLSGNSYYGYNYCVYNPADFYYGYENGFDVGADKGYGYGWNDGFDVGYVDGYTDGYDTGYNRGVSEISSGEFGRQLLGGLFSAPFEALGDFTIVEWETGNGTFTLSLATVLSAIIGVSIFVWFLKTFAGG